MHKRRRFTHVIVSLACLALMSWLAVRSYDSMIGRIYTGPLKDVFSNAFHLGKKARVRDFRIKAAIFYSDATAGSLKDVDPYDGLINAWARMLDQERISHDILDSKALLSGVLSSYNVLILPLATHLSDDEIAVIKQFVSKEGHGLIFSGAAGAHHENGDWRDISLTAEIIGGENIHEVAPDGARTVYMVLDGRNPLSANIPPGLRMSVNTYDRPLSAAILEPRTQTAGTWEGAGTGMANGRYRDGRFVWMGFTLGSEVDPFGLNVGQILLRNMLAYAAFKPLFAKEPWPEGKQAAVSFAEEADDALEDSAAAVSLFAQKRVPCTFFCTPASAQQYPDRFKRIASDPLFEVGLRGTGSYQSQPLEKQKALLVSGKQELEALSGRPVQGFSPFETLYDNNTVMALLSSGYSYLAGDALSSAPPSVLQARKPRFIRRGRDLNLFIKFPHANKADETKTLDQLKAEFDAVYRVGGFYNFSFYAERLKEAGQADVISQFIDYVKTKNVWIATLDQVADWSSRWMLVDVDSADATKARSNLLVTSNSPGQFESLRLLMHFPDDISSVTATSERLGGSINVIAEQKGEAVLEIRDIGASSLVFYVERH